MKAKELAIPIVVFTVIGFIAAAPYLGISSSQSKELSPVAASSTEAQVSVIMFLASGPIKQVPTASIYSLAEAQVMAISLRLMTVYNFQPYLYSPVFGMAAGYLPSDQVQRAYLDPQVVSIGYDYSISVRPASSTTGETSYLTLGEVAAKDNAADLWGMGWLGQGVKVAYIDSGAPAGVAVQEMSVDNGSPVDQYGHGSMVYDVIHTLAPQAHIVSIKVLDATGNGRISDVIKGLEMAVMDGDHVVNMSLGTPAGGFDSLAQACDLASSYYGVKIFAASGNVAEQGTLSPAISLSVVSVGAVDSNLQVTYYSSRGKVDTSAFGDISAMWLGSVQDISGTSCASPQVAALYADWLSGYPNWDAGRIDQFAAVRSASVGLGQSLSATGWGLLSGQALSQTEPTYAPTLLDRLALPLVLLAAVVFIIAAIVIWRVSHGYQA